MTPLEEKHLAEELTAKGQTLVSKAETILHEIIIRNARLSREVKQTRSELEMKLAAPTKT